MRLELDGWKLGLRFSACHIIPEHGKCGHLHGHTYTIHSHVFGTLNEHGIILDFEIIKNALRDVISELDHKLLIPKRNNKFEIQSGAEVSIKLGDKNYRFPNEDIIMLNIESATAESLANYILEKLLQTMDIPKNVTSLELGVDEGWGQGAWVSKSFDYNY
jgi:6-pyruvoyltetrahydropterin/6-carboxytetrahydropterin synthase